MILNIFFGVCLFEGTIGLAGTFSGRIPKIWTYIGEDPGQTVDLKHHWIQQHGSLTIYLIEMPFNTFANRVDPDQAALL